jgi:hypothetical protein
VPGLVRRLPSAVLVAVLGALVAVAPPAAGTASGANDLWSADRAASATAVTLPSSGGGPEVASTFPITGAQQLAWAPDGSMVAYVSAGALWLADASASQTWQLVTPPSGQSVTAPAWTPDGSLILFEMGTPARSRIYLAQAAPSNHGYVEAVTPDEPGVRHTNPTVGWFEMVYERVASGASTLVKFDQSATPPFTSLGGGRQPSLSPDETTVFAVETLSGVDQVRRVDIASGSRTTVFPDAAGQTWPEASPDGATVAWVRGGTQVVSGPATGTFTAGATWSSGGPTISRLHWRPLSDNGSRRLSGPDRIATAIAISAAGFPDPGSADVIVLSRSDLYPDALAAGPLGAVAGGPLLLTAPNALDARVAAEITRALKPDGTVYVLGGTGALSAAVAGAVTGLGYHLVRLQGPDRYSTSAAVATEVTRLLGGALDHIFVATGRDYPDALSATAAAAAMSSGLLIGAHGGVVLLADRVGGVLPTPTAAFLATHSSATVIAVGGPAVATVPSAVPVAGSDRYGTSALLADLVWSPAVSLGVPAEVGLATGQNFPDALAGGALAGLFGGPVLLTAPTALSTPTRDLLAGWRGGVRTVTAFGGPSVVSATTLTQALTAIGGRPVSGGTVSSGTVSEPAQPPSPAGGMAAVLSRR